MGFLREAVLESCSKPGVDEARHVYGCCRDEVVPRNRVSLETLVWTPSVGLTMR